MTFSMWTMLLPMFDKASKILNHIWERADASNLALFFFCSLFRERNFKNHRSCVSNSRPLRLETWVTSQTFWRGIPEMKSFLQGRKERLPPPSFIPSPFSYTCFLRRSNRIRPSKIEILCPTWQLGSVDGLVHQGFKHCDLTLSTRSPASCHGHQPRVLNIKRRNWPRQVETRKPARPKNICGKTGCCKEFWCVANNLFSKVEWLLMYVVLLNLLF